MATRFASRWGVALSLGLGALLSAGLAAAADPLNILYYGNSFTNATCCGSSRSVPLVLSDVAVAAGHVAPYNRNASVNGQSLQYHLNSNTTIITSGIAAGQDWDYVVLQDFSTQPTHIGDLPLHLSSSLALYQKVKDHSPGAQAVMYETWARGYGHSYYTGGAPAFPGGPAQMQQELRDGYQMSTDNINAVEGDGSARFAPAGDTWEDLNWPANFYGDVNYHASNRGTLLNALALYATIYEDDTTSDIDLSGVLTSLNLTAADGLLITTALDANLRSVPEPGAVVLGLLGCLVGAARRRRL
ncbi:hypothetical protein Pla123a_23580 [Posidoniimonas polymericola]|uniref:PEP-CTERM protein-sorting domain-containing protein n=1 Tax=Posidoniimonas polymericola TaxID=2528002 RepID=A0A5C5YPY4_9BACT|nr:hypothetical protein [Posidoniimonas polymericola]TWT76933.1 hypothetical protein Pla123a_23580 [Posidoniimonas polymericola]